MAEYDDELTARVKSLAREGGFDAVGIAPAGASPDAQRFRAWLARGHHASMAYLARNVEKRLRPDRLVPGARSVIYLAVGYAPDPARPRPRLGIARFARGRDYHKVLKQRCHRLMDRVREVHGDFVGRAFVDSAPVLERSAARAAGLGVIGWNGFLIVRALGSYVCLCEIVSDLPLAPDPPADGTCRQCGACLRACPTGALDEAGLDARLCISYLTIEHDGPIDPALRPQMGRRLAGCDRCQVVCPHNADVPAGAPALRGETEPLGGASLADVLAWTPADWDRATRGSAVRRVAYDRLIRNAVLAAGNSADTPERAQLAAALRDLRPRRDDLRDAIDWALGRLA